MRFAVRLVCVTVLAGVLAALLPLPVAGGSGAYRAHRLIHKHVRARGGLSRIHDIREATARGVIESQGIQADFTLWVKRPNLARMEASVRGRQVIQAYDGETAWWVNPFVGIRRPAQMPDAFARSLVRWVDFAGPLVDYRRKGHKAEYLGRRQLEDGVEAHEIALTLAGGEVWLVYLDAHTYLEVMRVFQQMVGDEANTVTTYFGGFREIEGVKVPTIVEGIGFMGVPYTLRVDEIDVNTDVDPTRFTMPVGSE